ncbi:methyltransferase [Thalassotalea montiporae]
MALSNLSQVLVRNIGELACTRAVLVNFPVDGLYQEWLDEYPECQLHYFTNNKLAADQLAQITAAQPSSKLSYSFGTHLTAEQSQETKQNKEAKQNKEDIAYDLAVIAFPKSKAELAYSLAMLAPHLAEDARVLFVGENKGGIKSAAKLSQGYISHCHKLDSARHCSLFAGQFIRGDYSFNLADWFHYYPLSVAGIELNIAALPGVFSQKQLDKGTQVLLENLPTEQLPKKSYQGKLLDFGCGAGVISAFLAKQYPETEITALDISALAVASTQETLKVNNLTGEVFASDGLIEVNGSFSHIVTNPPFHQGLKTHYAATETFLRECPKRLVRGGNLTVVANSFLKYQPILAEGFKQLQTIVNQRGFAVYFASM